MSINANYQLVVFDSCKFIGAIVYKFDSVGFKNEVTGFDQLSFESVNVTVYEKLTTEVTFPKCGKLEINNNNAIVFTIDSGNAFG